ncbi:MAG TPA: hypothetical protein VFV92_07140, partial [Candidatus Bathyarchaeia archaeon]|nr:hypothetical protein [Candidatus Bathyarchaeia archaeon]
MAESMAEALQDAGVRSEDMPTDRRSVMERAFTETHTETPEGEIEPKSHWSGEGKREEPVVKPKEEVKPVQEKLPESKVRAAKTVQPKDGDGKFVKADKQPVVKTDATPDKTGEGEGKAVKAPVSWTPEARELFSKIPPRVQQEIAKREGEITRALQDSAAARKVGAQLYNIIKPNEHLIRASGVSPMQAIANLVH